MKIRTDFVTNSSSSSFILAVKNGVSSGKLADDVKKCFSGGISQIIGDLECYEYELKEEFGDDISDVDEERLVEFIVKDILNECKDGMKLGDWLVAGGECGSESGSLLYNIFYSTGSYDSKNLKFKQNY